MEDAKNQFLQSRPNGAGDSALGEGMADYMTKSPKHKKYQSLQKERACGSVSMKTTPKGSSKISVMKAFEPDQILQLKS